MAAIDPDEAGDLQAVFGPAEQRRRAGDPNRAKTLALNYIGVIAWLREAKRALGVYGRAMVLFQRSNEPDME
ncbi:hypothetical protein ACSBOB_09045 [Mesorhizobium sp. ASY16-5R]|uniref:hypothetical protein n=1 Tax=Mesorhizobium sp. ASY16-5R TaxID=3445772 RepID=UPI003FA149F1